MLVFKIKMLQYPLKVIWPDFGINGPAGRVKIRHQFCQICGRLDPPLDNKIGSIWASPKKSSNPLRLNLQVWSPRSTMGRLIVSFLIFPRPFYFQ